MTPIVEIFIRIVVAIATPFLAAWGWYKLTDVLSSESKLFPIFIILSGSVVASLVFVIWYICWIGGLP